MCSVVWMRSKRMLGMSALPQAVHIIWTCAEHSFLDPQVALAHLRISRRTCLPKVYTANESPKLIATLAYESSEAIAFRKNSWLHVMLCCTLTRLHALRLVDETLHHFSITATGTTLVHIRPLGTPALILLALSGIQKDIAQRILLNIKARGSKGEAAIDEGRNPRVVQGFVHHPFEEVDV